MEQDVALRKAATDAELRERAARRVILIVQEEDSREDFEKIVHDGALRWRPGQGKG